MADLKNLVEEMAAQKAAGKKDKYIDITHELLTAAKDVKDEEARLDYCQALLDTLDNMDFMIYELYRGLQDMLVIQLKKAMEEEGNDRSEKLSDLVKEAADRKFIIGEKYQLQDEKETLDEAIFDQAGDEVEVLTLKYDARFAVIQINDGGKYNTLKKYRIYLNYEYAFTTDKVITTIYDLKPGTEYEIQVVAEDKSKIGTAEVTTDFEYVTLNVKDFGAKGDGVQDDTKFIQAAIMACTEFSRVLIPEGTYLITSLFLASNVRIELAENARLLAKTDRQEFVHFPALVQTYFENNEYNLGTWEGNPIPMYAGIITGLNVENVVIYGKGTIDGGASKENWWADPKHINVAARPRLFFLNNCNNVSLIGVTCCNSPSWTLHPYFSDDLSFYDLYLNNPADSPNTDGCDPESCGNVEIAGVRFTLGDDCIAVKSGKIYMGRKLKKPSENISIHNCLMENGHGAVTIGSEMAGGVKELTVENCVFSHTDRGLRIKTRRGRGKDAIIDGITFRDIDMDNVMTPFVANSFYFCDPDGKTDYVQSREEFPVDDRTPEIRKMVFENIMAKECHVAAAYFEGLPEKKIEEIVMRNIHVDYSANPEEDVPAMSNGVEKSTKRGLVAKGIKKLVLEKVEIVGAASDDMEIENVDEVVKR